jgi:hypothetical protein
VQWKVHFPMVCHWRCDLFRLVLDYRYGLIGVRDLEMKLEEREESRGGLQAEEGGQNSFH